MRSVWVERVPKGKEKYLAAKMLRVSPNVLLSSFLYKFDRVTFWNVDGGVEDRASLG